MSRSSINSMSELEAEIARLKALNVRQEEELMTQFKAVEEYIQPHNVVRRTVRGLFTNTDANRTFYSAIISTGIDLLLQRFTGKQGAGLVQGLGRSFLSAALGKLAASNYGTIVEKIRSFFSKDKEEGREEGTDKEEERPDEQKDPPMKMGSDEV